MIFINACAHASRSKDPRNWLELESEHFLLHTDVPEQQARKSLDEMEQVREALVGISWTGARPLQDRLTVVLLADESEMAEFRAKHVVGFATYNAFYQRLIVIHAGDDVYRQSTFKHELTHILSDAFSKPRWVSEGLACFLETLAFKDGEVEVGQPDSDRLQFMKEWAPMPWFSYLSGGGEVYNEALYGYSFETFTWALIHYLVDERPKALEKYLAALSSGVDSWRAFTEAFPGLREEELTATMHRYIRNGRYGRYRFPAKTWHGTIAARALPPAEALALRADLLRFSTEAGLGDRELDQALAIDPGNPYALLLKRGASAKAATAAHPDDWRAWLLAFDRGGERRADIEQAARLAPNEPGVLGRLAVTELREREPKLALDHALRAQQAAPSRSELLVVLSEAYAVNGRCTEAIAAQQQAIDVRTDASVTNIPKEMKVRLLDLRNHCEPPPAAVAKVVETPAEPESDEIKLKSCAAAPPKLKLKSEVRVDFTLDTQGRPKDVTVQDKAVDKATRARLRRWVESCRYEPFTVHGQVQEAPSSMTLSPPAAAK